MVSARLGQPPGTGLAKPFLDHEFSTR